MNDRTIGTPAREYYTARENADPAPEWCACVTTA